MSSTNTRAATKEEIRTIMIAIYDYYGDEDDNVGQQLVFIEREQTRAHPFNFNTK